MGYKFLQASLFICFASIIVLALYAMPAWTFYIAGGIGLALVLLISRSIILPLRSVSTGIDLLNGQDFNSRLAKVNEPNADKIVRLFNTVIGRLHEEQLHNLEQENLLSLIVEASPMGIAMLDYDGLLTMANNSFLKICGFNDIENIKGKHPRELPSVITRHMAGMSVGERRIIRIDGANMYRCWYLSVMQKGFPRGFYLIESLTEEIMQAERRAYGKVIRTISHEVNNTMTGVRSLLQMLSESSVAEDERELIESCDARCESMCSFITDYADVVRLPDPVMKREDLNSTIETMLPFLRRLAGEKADIIFTPRERELVVEMDSSLIEQVIVNIVKNAVESIDRPDGHIEIKTARENGLAVLSISNNGRPIDETVSEQMFNPFFTTKRDGKGIGLTLSSEILNRHDAVYSLRSEETSEGWQTTFRIRFQS